MTTNPKLPVLKLETYSYQSFFCNRNVLCRPHPLVQTKSTTLFILLLFFHSKVNNKLQNGGLGLPFVLIIANDERPQSRQFHPKYLWLLTLIKQNYGNLINYVNASRTSVGSSKSGSDLLSGEKQCSTMFLDTCSNLGGFHCI